MSIGTKPTDDTNITTIVTSLSKTSNENLDDQVNQMFRKLGDEIMEKVSVSQSVRLISRQPAASGIVKVAMETVGQKKKILRAKYRLNDTVEYQRVYIRSSKTHTERLFELNVLTLLNQLPNRNDFCITGNGRIVRKAADGNGRNNIGWSQSAENRETFSLTGCK